MLQPAETLQSIAVSSVIAARNGQHRLDDALEESLPGPTGPTGPGPQPVEPASKARAARTAAALGREVARYGDVWRT